MINFEFLLKALGLYAAAKVRRNIGLERKPPERVTVAAAGFG